MITRKAPPRKRRPGPPRRGPERDADYLAFIREQPCIVESRFCEWQIEAAHIGPHGGSQKASDYSTLPVCLGHHLKLHALGKTFWDLYAVDRDKLIAHYRALYSKLHPERDHE